MADEQVTPTNETPPAAERTFTQADLDRVVKERLDREKAKYADYDDHKRAAGRLKEIEDKGKSESEKLTGRLAEIEKALGLKDQAIKDLEGRLAGERRANLAGSVASRLGAHDPSDANILAAISAIDPAGANAGAEIEAALKKLAETKPYLFKQAGAQGPTRLEGFNPGTQSGAAATDQQKVKNLLGAVGINTYGPLGR